jgi:hypothetical protein
MSQPSYNMTAQAAYNVPATAQKETTSPVNNSQAARDSMAPTSPTAPTAPYRDQDGPSKLQPASFGRISPQ